jgi:hypothetical protein
LVVVSVVIGIRVKGVSIPEKFRNFKTWNYYISRLVAQSSSTEVS